MTSKELLDIDFEISVTSTSSDADIIAEVSGHFDTDDHEFDDEEQPIDWLITEPAFKDIMNAITDLEDYSLISKFGADLMKVVKDYVIRSRPQSKIFSKLC